MDDHTKNFWGIVISATNTLGVLIGALWAYFRFWREGIHCHRIEFDIQCTFLGSQRDARVVSFVVLADNKGTIEHRFSRISLRVLGITRAQNLTRRQDGRLNFPETILKAELVPEKFNYYFVRPGVAQPFTFTTTVPADVRFILARSAFQYESSEGLHTSERVFEIPSSPDAETNCKITNAA